MTEIKTRLTQLLTKAVELSGHPAQRVCKFADEGGVRIELTFPQGKLVLRFSKQVGLHALIGATIEMATDGHINKYEAVRDDGDRLDVHPIMLAELTKMSASFGGASARLLQGGVVADGETNHAGIVAGHFSKKSQVVTADA